MMNVGTCYLLHLDAPLSPDSPARHYLGWTRFLPARALAHLKGRSAARFMEVAHERNIGFVIARTWPGDRTFERRLKKRKEAPRLCPICRNQVTLDLEEDLL